MERKKPTLKEVLKGLSYLVVFEALTLLFLMTLFVPETVFNIHVILPMLVGAVAFIAGWFVHWKKVTRLEQQYKILHTKYKKLRSLYNGSTVISNADDEAATTNKESDDTSDVRNATSNETLSGWAKTLSDLEKDPSLVGSELENAPAQDDQKHNPVEEE